MGKSKNVTVAQVMEIKKMADEKGIGRDAFGLLYGEFGRVLDGALAAPDIIAAIEAGRTELWLHPDQANRWVNGRVIQRHLTDAGLLAGCIDLAEAKAIQAKGIDFWRKHFAGKVIVAWGGVQDDSVPYLYENEDEVVLYWDWIGRHFYSSIPALRRK